MKKIKTIINGRKYKKIGFAYTDNPKRKYKVMILWTEGWISIHSEKMTLKEIENTDWQMGVQAFPIYRDCLEKKG